MTDILATSFVSDSSQEASIFPAAGGDSSSERVKQVYWRCIVVFYASARISNPTLDFHFYTNREPPVLDGRPMREVLEAFGVKIVIVPLTHRFQDQRSSSWGNVLYFLDVLDAVEFTGDDQGFVLCDSDVAVVRSITPLLEQVHAHGFVGYEVGRPPGESINSMSREEMTRMAAAFHGRAFDQPVRDFGGELLAVTGGAWKRNREKFAELYRQAVAGDGLAGQISTEEHFFSIIFAGLVDNQVMTDRETLKRLWTSRKFNTVKPGDERYALWHLPAEKRYGLTELYKDLRTHDFRTDMSPEDLVALAGRRCGIPAPSFAKRARDLVTALRLGLV